MGFLSGGVIYTVFWFVVVLTVLVFVHELGHYLVARWNKVRIEVFSIGFGPEIFGWNDRAGTRWKFSAMPLGGYVKMFGDADPASMPASDLPAMTAEEREVSFHHKRLPQRAAVVAAGPLANFIFALIVLTGLYATVGQSFTVPEVGVVDPGSAAEAGGIKQGDIFLTIDGQPIERFEDVQRLVQISTGTPLALVLKRGDGLVTLSVTPKLSEIADRFGNKHQFSLLGIHSQGLVQYVRYDPLSALRRAGTETVNSATVALQAVWQMIVGARTADDLGGPLRIAQMSGEMAHFGIAAVLSFMAFLSVNLGLINLFPIPVLDGGHLLFYAAEAIRGKPLGHRAQEYGFRLGLALVLTLMVFATWNDVVHLGVVEFLKRLVS
jgi:regulator of sigma E protease